MTNISINCEKFPLNFIEKRMRGRISNVLLFFNLVNCNSLFSTTSCLGGSRAKLISQLRRYWNWWSPVQIIFFLGAIFSKKYSWHNIGLVSLIIRIYFFFEFGRLSAKLWKNCFMIVTPKTIGLISDLYMCVHVAFFLGSMAATGVETDLTSDYHALHYNYVLFCLVFLSGTCNCHNLNHTGSNFLIMSKFCSSKSVIY